MNKDSLIKRCRGINVFAVTPMKEQGGATVIDEEGVGRNMEALAKAGIPVAVVCGGVGELWSLTEEEHDRVVRAAVQAVGGRICVFAGIYGDAESSIQRARRVQKAGADGVLLFPDDAVVPDSAAVLKYYTQVSQAIDIGMMPFRADDTVTIEVIQRLADLPNVVSLKEEKEHMGDFRRIVLAAGHRLTVIGAGDIFAPCYFVLGAGGLACGLSNFLPKLYVEMWEAAQLWDYRRVLEIHTSLLPFDEIRGRNGTSALKAALELIGLAGGPTRSGRTRIQGEDREKLAELLKKFPNAW